MRVLICGGRDFTDASLVWGTLDTLRITIPHDAMTVLQGGARGADQLAREWCSSRCVPYINYPAYWGTDGKAAGPLRNQRMIDDGKPDLVVAFPGGRGTADMVARAEKARLNVMRVK